MTTARTTRLREMMNAPEILMAPGAQDALTAVLVEDAGFDAVFVGTTARLPCSWANRTTDSSPSTR